ncbi:hypothetical protein ACJX0J_009824 [Zea mays]
MSNCLSPLIVQSTIHTVEDACLRSQQIIVFVTDDYIKLVLTPLMWQIELLETVFGFISFEQAALPREEEGIFRAAFGAYCFLNFNRWLRWASACIRFWRTGIAAVAIVQLRDRNTVIEVDLHEKSVVMVKYIITMAFRSNC